MKGRRPKPTPSQEPAVSALRQPPNPVRFCYAVTLVNAYARRYAIEGPLAQSSLDGLHDAPRCYADHGAGLQGYSQSLRESLHKRYGFDR
jgi:hypothetical protein